MMMDDILPDPMERLEDQFYALQGQFNRELASLAQSLGNLTERIVAVEEGLVELEAKVEGEIKRKIRRLSKKLKAQ
jgi:hypothetical protein